MSSATALGSCCHFEMQLPGALSRAALASSTPLANSTWRRLCSRQCVCLRPRPPTAIRMLLVENVHHPRVPHHLNDALRLCAHALSTPMRIMPLRQHAIAHARARAHRCLIAVALYLAMSTVREHSSAKDRPRRAAAKKSKKTSLLQLPRSRLLQRLNMSACSPCAREEHTYRQPGCALYRLKSEMIHLRKNSSAWLGRPSRSLSTV